VYCDALTLTAVADELRHELLGGRIQDVLELNRYVIGFEMYAHRRAYLLMSARPEEGGRIHLVGEKLRRGVEMPSPLLLRLRKEIIGSRLVDVQQPAWERLLQLSCKGPQGDRVLVVEAMGQRSNIILVEEDGTILECARHIPASQNRYRVLLPGCPYVPPPAQNKANGLTLTAGRLSKLLEEQEATLPLWRKLVAAVSGVSPLLAREIAYRAGGDPNCQHADVRTVLDQLQEVLVMTKTGQWQPNVAVEGDRVLAYAPYALTQYPRCEVRSSISQAMTDYYAQRVGADAYAVAKARVQKLIEKQRERLSHKKEALLAENPSPEAVEKLRRNGEWLLACAHQVVPGQTELVVQWDDAQSPVHILLDPTLSPVENAREYFRRYEKAKNAAMEVPALLAQVDGELAYLDQLTTDLVLAEDRPGIDAVEAALALAGYIPKSKKVRPQAAAPLNMLSEDGFTILVGRNSWQNEQVTFHCSAEHDFWLHARGVPGAHVVVRTEGRDVPEPTLRRAAELAAYYSAARLDKKVLVDYALCKNVRRRKGGKEGQVVYQGQKTLSVRPKGADV